MSMKSVLTVAALVAALSGANAIYAQAPNLDAVPDKMPFDVPYGAPISLDRAEAVLNAALAESKKRDWKLICGVVDSGANLVSFKRQDGSQIASIDIAFPRICICGWKFSMRAGACIT